MLYVAFKAWMCLNAWTYFIGDCAEHEEKAL